jgi:hypothetical protein
VDELALSARFARAALQFEATFADAGQGGSILLHQAAFVFCLNVLAGWHKDADTVGQLLLKGLDTSLLDLRHNDRHRKGELYRHFWFLLHLYCNTKGLIMNTSLYSYPQDMRPYADALANLRTTDIDAVQSLVSSMADFHLQEARDTSHDEIAEFDNDYQMLFPYEILCFLRLREWLELPNPDSFQHPLLNQPLALLPQPLPLPLPDTQLLDKVIKEFQQQYLGSFA